MYPRARGSFRPPLSRNGNFRPPRRNQPEYDDYDFGQYQSSSQQQQQQTRYKSSSARRRDDQRRDEHREKKGAEKLDSLSKELDKALFFGFTMESKAIEAQKVKATPQAKVLPVSTRVVGLATQSVFIKINQTMRNIPQCTVHEAYRVSLAQLEMKVSESGKNQIQNSNQDIADYQQSTLSLDHRQALLGSQINFNVTASAINAIGNFEYKETRYYTKVPYDQNPNPLLVTFSNLRRTVTALADEQTPRDLRLHFYNNNALPGAIWNGVRPAVGRRRRRDDQGNPVLANPLDFWPEDYDIHQFLDDIQRFNGLMAWMSRKSLKYVNLESRIDFNGSGSPTCLVSSRMNDDLRNADPVIIDDRFDWANTPMPIGLRDEFWTPEFLDETTMFIGTLQLLGETPPLLDHRYYIRDVHVSALRSDYLWTALFINMMG